MKKINLLFVLAYGFLLALFTPPLFNWDIIGYTGAAYYAEGLRSEALRQTVYSEIQTITSSHVFEDLTLSGVYRKKVFTEPQSLEEHMPFYTIRMAYISAMKITSSLFSIPYAKSTYVLSAFFSGLCVLLLGVLFPTKNMCLLLTFPIVLYIAGFPELASLSSPDAMATSLALLSFITYRKILLAIIPLSLIPWVRTDYVIWTGLIALVAAYNRRFLQATLYLTLPLISYVLVNKINHNYGYLKIFNFTLIGIDPHPATMTIETSILPYLQAYSRGFGSFLGHPHFFIFLAYILVWFKFFKQKAIREVNEQVFLITGFVLLHMLLFPAYYSRFFTWCAAIAGLQLIAWIYELKTQRLNNMA